MHTDREGVYRFIARFRTIAIKIIVDISRETVPALRLSVLITF